MVHIKNSGVAGRDGWVKKIQIMPGRNGGTLPFGSVTSTSFRSVTGWTGTRIVSAVFNNMVAWKA